MRVNWRMFLAMVCGLGCTILAMWLEGGHPTELLSLPSLLIVGITGFGGLVLLRGVRRTGTVLAGAFVVAEPDCADRDERIEALEVLERTILLGGLLGMVFGATHAISRLDEPQRVGPALAIAFTSLIVAVALQAFFVLPQKHQLLRAHDAALRLPARRAVAAAFGIGGAFLLACTGVAFAGDFPLALNVPHALLLVGALAPSMLVASDSPLRGPWSGQRLLGYSNAFVAAGLLGVGTGLMHVFSVLDQPPLLGPGIALATSSLLWPLVGCVLLRLKLPTPGTTTNEGRPGAGTLHPLFAGCALAMMAGLTVLVLALCSDSA